MTPVHILSRNRPRARGRGVVASLTITNATAQFTLVHGQSVIRSPSPSVSSIPAFRERDGQGGGERRWSAPLRFGVRHDIGTGNSENVRQEQGHTCTLRVLGCRRHLDGSGLGEGRCRGIRHAAVGVEFGILQGCGGGGLAQRGAPRFAQSWAMARAAASAPFCSWAFCAVSML
jgi:hypothetical protein